MTDSTATTPDPDVIERDVKRTQDEIGETIDEIEERLDPGEMTRSLLGDGGEESTREIIDIARTNPIPVAMIAVGLVWLLATSDSPPIRRVRERITGKRGSGNGLRSRSEEPAPIGPPPATGARYDRRRRTAR